MPGLTSVPLAAPARACRRPHRARGPGRPAPNRELGIIMTTTYWGLLHGANEANTEVASLPATSAVPVLPATHTVPSGKRAKAPAAVPDVTTPRRAFLM